MALVVLVAIVALLIAGGSVYQAIGSSIDARRYPPPRAAHRRTWLQTSRALYRGRRTRSRARGGRLWRVASMGVGTAWRCAVHANVRLRPGWPRLERPRTGSENCVRRGRGTPCTAHQRARAWSVRAGRQLLWSARGARVRGKIRRSGCGDGARRPRSSVAVRRRPAGQRRALPGGAASVGAPGSICCSDGRAGTSAADAVGSSRVVFSHPHVSAGAHSRDQGGPLAHVALAGRSRRDEDLRRELEGRGGPRFIGRVVQGATHVSLSSVQQHADRVVEAIRRVVDKARIRLRQTGITHERP